MGELITEIDILDEAKDCFLTYSEEVLTDRAIPSIEDGLLSVQRKIIWTMEEVLKMSNKVKHKKSASIVGSTLASSYFHGDSSCYGALCKMAQSYLMRYPLVDGDGNFGTQEGNGLEAASRYTNARPSRYADLMMNDFKKNVIPLKETYNGEYMEPVVLPSLFPNALVNGREAIGISMSHNSLPMCLSEVCDGINHYIDKRGNVTVEEMMNYIKGPDFPLGGTIINGKDIKAAFETGRSKVSLKVRGDYEVKDDKIIFTSIPYRTYRDKIKEQITKNIDELDKYIEDFNDESNVGKNRLIFHLKKGISASTALNAIFTYTDLQTTLSYNMNFIVNGTPKLCSLIDLVKGYVDHQISIIIKSTTFDMKKAEERVHILRGLLAAIDKIDEVIVLIKSSNDKSDARNKLMSFLSIDEIQANAILDMKLSKLAKIEKNELREELDEKEKFIEYCKKILSDENVRYDILKDKVTNMKNKIGDERRTKIDNIEFKKDKKIVEEIPPEECVVIISETGAIKRIPAASFKTQKRNGVGVKTADSITSFSCKTNTRDILMIFTNYGKLYKLLVNDIPVGTNVSSGIKISTLIEFETGEEPKAYASLHYGTSAKYVMFATKNGIVKKVPLEEYMSTKRSGVKAITFKGEDSVSAVTFIEDEEIILATKNGMSIHFDSKTIPISSRIAQGVIGMKLNDGDEVIALLPIKHKTDNVAIFSIDGYGKQVKLEEFTLQGRAGKGLAISKTGIAGIALVSNTDKILVIGETNSICIEASELPVLSRTSQGNVIIKNNKIIKSVTKI